MSKPERKSFYAVITYAPGENPVLRCGVGTKPPQDHVLEFRRAEFEAIRDLLNELLKDEDEYSGL